MKWNHARKGLIEGEIIADDGEFVDIRLAAMVRMGFGDPFHSGFRSVNAGQGDTIRVRKSFLSPVPKSGGTKHE